MAEKDNQVMWGCAIILGLTVLVSFIVIMMIDWDGYENKEGYYMWGPGYYPGYWGYRVPPWRRRWWWRRRKWGMPLSRYYRPYYGYGY